MSPTHNHQEDENALGDNRARGKDISMNEIVVEKINDFTPAEGDLRLPETKPLELKSKRFYSEERYHYLDNKDKIDSELKEFKLDIEKKFKNAATREYKFQRVAFEDSFEVKKQTPVPIQRGKQKILFTSQSKIHS